MPGIDDLIFLMKGGAITPQDALGTYEAQEEARRQRRIERRQAMAESQQSSLDELGTLATSEAQQGTSLEDLASLASAKIGQSMTPEQLYSVPGVSDVYLPTGQQGFTGNAGQSRINPTLPPNVASAIQADLMNGEETPESIMQKLQQKFGPNTFSRLLPEISTLVDSAIRRSGSWSGGK